MRVARISTSFIDIPGQVSLSIYLTGCSLRCSGCHNPQLQDYGSPHKVYTPHELAERTARSRSLIDYVTWMGGEPSEHPDIEEGMKAMKRELPEIRQAMYTGHYMDDVKHLIPYLDLIVAGPWQGLPASDPDTNQQTWLKDRDGWRQVNYSTLTEKAE